MQFFSDCLMTQTEVANGVANGIIQLVDVAFNKSANSSTFYFNAQG